MHNTNLYYTHYQDQTPILIGDDTKNTEELHLNFVLSLFDTFIVEQRKTE